MLILSRKTGESIVIDGRITVKVVRVEGEVVKVGIEAPMDVQIHRQEVYEEIQRNNRQAMMARKQPLPKIPLKKQIKPEEKKTVPAAPTDTASDKTKTAVTA